MFNLDDSIKRLEKEKSLFVYTDDVLQKEEVTYGEVILLLDEFAKTISKEQFLECQISSETEIVITDNEELWNLFIDTEWTIPSIAINQHLIWHPRKHEKIVKIDGLNENLMAIYYVQSDEYYLTIISKEVYNNRRVSDDVLDILVQISNGDMALMDSIEEIEEKKFKEVIDYLVRYDYAFTVHKNLVGSVERIKIESTIEWEKKENYSVEFTKKGRENYANNELSLDVMKFTLMP